LALLLRIHPILGGATALLVGTFLVWGIENRTRLATETVIGVVFSTALAIGSLITSGEELIEALFGGVGHLTTMEASVGFVLAFGVIVFVLWQRHRLVLALVSPEIAHTTGINVQRLNLCFLLVFALTIALGLRYLGVLLVGSLVIIPAATAKRLARSLRSMLAISVVVSIASTTLGTLALALTAPHSGPYDRPRGSGLLPAESVAPLKSLRVSAQVIVRGVDAHVLRQRPGALHFAPGPDDWRRATGPVALMRPRRWPGEAVVRPPIAFLKFVEHRARRRFGAGACETAWCTCGSNGWPLASMGVTA